MLTKTLTLLGAMIFIFVAPANGQKIKTKDIKKAIEGNQVEFVKLISPETFTPEIAQDFDLEITLQNETKLLASEHHIIWNYAEITATHATVKIKGEFLANGKGRLHSESLSEFYQNDKINLEVTLAGKRDSKVLTANYCIAYYNFERKGTNGYSGTLGSSGYNGSHGSNGSDGKNGGNGPDMEIQIDEEVIRDKTFVVITHDGKKYPLDPSCSTITIYSAGGDGGRGGDGGDGGDGARSQNKYTGSGGRGGNGGDGGRGGNGGNLVVSGNAVEKYGDKIKFISKAGRGGAGGRSGRGGNGTVSGSSGRSGTSGSDGAPGQVVVKKG